MARESTLTVLLLPEDLQKFIVPDPMDMAA
jgi:hypothetical protein